MNEVQITKIERPIQVVVNELTKSIKVFIKGGSSGDVPPNIATNDYIDPITEQSIEGSSYTKEQVSNGYLKKGNTNNLQLENGETIPQSNILGSATEWLILVNQEDVIPYPAMSKGERKIVRINKIGESVTVRDGWATIGGSEGVRIGHMAMLVCMEDSTGGTQAEVGDKYAIIGNLIDVDIVKKYYGEIANPNINTPNYDFKIGDYYIHSEDGTPDGEVHNIWLYTGKGLMKFVDPFGTIATDGIDGDTPEIGENGNWWIGGVDTGVSATYRPKIIYDGSIIGLRNGVNQIFTAPDIYKPGTLKVYFNGVLLTKGNNSDYTEINPGQIDNGAHIVRIVTNKDLLIFEYEV